MKNWIVVVGFVFFAIVALYLVNERYNKQLDKISQEIEGKQAKIDSLEIIMGQRNKDIALLEFFADSLSNERKTMREKLDLSRRKINELIVEHENTEKPYNPVLVDPDQLISDLSDYFKSKGIPTVID